MTENSESRLATAFHETLPLSRPQLGQVLESLANAPRSIDLTSKKSREQYLRETTHLGTNQVVAMPNYALGTGLINADYQLTNFGCAVLHHDRFLDKSPTQWLMHYHLAAPQGPGPIFWNKLVTEYFRSGDEFSAEEIAEETALIAAVVKGRELATRTTNDTATIFLGSYMQRDGLGSLGMLETQEDNRYRVLDPEPPSAWAFGIALLDYWNAHFGDRLTINLSDLLTSGGLGDLFLIGSRRVDGYLSQLQEEGYVEVYRVAHPYQVVLLKQDPEPLLQKLYELVDPV